MGDCLDQYDSWQALGKGEVGRVRERVRDWKKERTLRIHAGKVWAHQGSFSHTHESKVVLPREKSKRAL